MSRQLHTRDILTRSDHSLQEVIESRASGDILIIMPDDERLDAYNPEQQTLNGSRWSFPSSPEVYVGTIPHKGDQDPLPYSEDQFDTVISLFSRRQLVKRMIPFHEFIWLTRGGGHILQATGLLPKENHDHDFGGWVSESEDATLNELVVTRYEGFKTPYVLGDWTVDNATHTPATRR